MFFSLFFFLSCRNTEPIMSGIEEPLLEDVSSAQENRVIDAQKQVPSSPYEKSEQVYIDINYIGGKRLSVIQDVIQDQLGDFISKRAISPKNGQIRTYENGILRVVDGQIYMIKINLPTPVRRSTALIQTGFPEQVGDYLTTHKEYQLLNEWGFRRIRMRRQKKYDELITTIEAWKWVPNEQVRK